MMGDMPQDVPRFEVNGAPGEPIELPVGGGPATGHQWFLDLPDGLRSASEIKPDADSPASLDPESALGGGTTRHLAVVADAPGDYVVRAELARPWDRDHPVNRVEVLVHVS